MARQDYPVEWLLQGDINGDGRIDMGDVMAVAGNYNKPAGAAPECDLDCDGWISIIDVEKVQRNFGLKCELWEKAVSDRRKNGAVLVGGMTSVIVLVVGLVGGL